MISEGKSHHHHDHFAHHVRTKSWGMDPIWKFVGNPGSSSLATDSIVYPRRANELRNNSLPSSNPNLTRGPTTIPIVRSVEIKLVGPLRGRLDNSPTLSSVRRSSISDSEDAIAISLGKRISPLSSLNSSSGGSSSSDDDSVPQTVADVKSIIEQRRSNFENRSFRRNSTPTVLPDRVSSLLPTRTLSLPIRPAPNRYSPPSSFEASYSLNGLLSTAPKESQNNSSAIVKPRKISPPLDPSSSSSSQNNSIIGTYPAPLVRKTSLGERSSFRSKPQHSSSLPGGTGGGAINGSSGSGNKKTHAGDHQRTLNNISKFLNNYGAKSTSTTSKNPQPAHEQESYSVPPIIPPAVIPPGVLKKPGADKGHRSLKKVAFLENAEFSRGLP